jgi:prophage antirepressor-like protein
MIPCLQFQYNDQPVRIIGDAKNEPLWLASDAMVLVGLNHLAALADILVNGEVRWVPEESFDSARSTGKVPAINARGLMHVLRALGTPRARLVRAWCRDVHFPALRAAGLQVPCLLPKAPKAPKAAVLERASDAPPLGATPGMPNRALETFSYQSQAVRVVTGEDGEPWFVAIDVCKVLDIRNASHAIKRLDDDERMQVIDPGTLVSSYGSNSKVNDQINIVSESGLYSLILASRKPEAKAFKRWITHEILPALRKTGTYTVPAAVTSPKRRGRLPLAERPTPADAMLPVPYNRFHATFRDVYALQKKVFRDRDTATRAALFLTGRHLQVDPTLYVPNLADLGLPEPALPPPTAASDAVHDDTPRLASELAVMLKLCHATGSGDGARVNALLIATGLATRTRDRRVVPTKAGERFAHTTPVPGHDGCVLTHVAQVRWSAGVLTFLRKALEAETRREAQARQGRLFPDELDYTH